MKMSLLLTSLIIAGLCTLIAAVPASATDPGNAVKLEGWSPDDSRLDVQFSTSMARDRLALPVLTDVDGDGQFERAEAEITETAITATTQISYRLSALDNLAISLPVVQRSSTITMGSMSANSKSDGIGDLTLAYLREFPDRDNFTVRRAVGVMVTAPTGRSAFSENDAPPIGSGFWGVGAQAEWRRAMAPTTVGVTIGVEQLLPRHYQGALIRPPLGFRVATEMGIALGPRLTMHETLSYSYAPSPLLGENPSNVMTEQAYVTHAFTWSGRTTSASLGITLGLTDASTDMQVEASIIRSF